MILFWLTMMLASRKRRQNWIRAICTVSLLCIMCSIVLQLIDTSRIVHDTSYNANEDDSIILLHNVTDISTNKDEAKAIKEGISIITYEEEENFNKLQSGNATAGKDQINGTMQGSNTNIIPLPPPVSPPKDYLTKLTNLTDGLQSNITCPFPLVPVYNHIIIPSEDINSISNSSSGGIQAKIRRIPRILHFSAKSRCIPQDVFDFIDRWKVKMPNHSIFLHDDNAVSKLIHDQDLISEFPDVARMMPCVKPGAMTIDVWRLLVLYKFGGTYSDLDNWLEEGFYEDMIGEDESISFFTFSDDYLRPTQHFLSVEPQLPLFKMAIQELIERVLRQKKVGYPAVLQVTGPFLFSNVYESFLNNYTRNEVFRWEGGKFTGVTGHKVQKIGLDANKSNTGKYLSVKKGYGELVTSHFNSTIQMTRKERIEQDSGQLHWQKALYREGKMNKSLKMPLSCKDVLRQIQDEQ